MASVPISDDEYTDRYVEAATRTLPMGRRAD